MAKHTINDRKLAHINIVKDENVEPLPSSFDAFRLPYVALPEIDMAEIDTRTSFLGKQLNFPFIISSMTGGPDKGGTINKNLALAAEKMKVGLGLGSMRVIVRKPESLASFNIRKYCPSIPLLANVGIVQLNYGFGLDEINYLIDSIEADGIFLHVNPLQEAVQPEGDTNFKGLLPKLEKIISKIKQPVVIKEVGAGINAKLVKQLAEIGVKWIDVSGTGGTSWAWVEGYRRDDNLGELFAAEGITTAEALITARGIKDVSLIAGGGIRNGLHIAKSIALGAKLATAAKPLLEPALTSPEACISVLEKFERELRIAMFCAGVKDLKALSKVELESGGCMYC